MCLQNKAAKFDKMCVWSRKKRQYSVSQSSYSEKQCNQQQKMVVMIAQGEGAEFQHAVFSLYGVKEMLS